MRPSKWIRNPGRLKLRIDVLVGAWRRSPPARKCRSSANCGTTFAFAKRCRRKAAARRKHSIRQACRSCCKPRSKRATAYGRLKKARHCLEKSITEGRRIGTQYDEARALLDLSAVDTNRQTELRNEAVGILKRLKAVIPYAERWQLGDVPDPACVAPEYRPDDRIIKATG